LSMGGKLSTRSGVQGKGDVRTGRWRSGTACIWVWVVF
jgi:hypothetical protein